MIYSAELRAATLNIKLDINPKEDGFLELVDLELDVSIGSATVSISFMNF